MNHTPVLTKEVLELLDPKPNENFIDGTIGGAGHAKLILEKTSPFGKLLGIDADKGQITNARYATQKFNERVLLVQGSYADMTEITARVRLKPIHGILLDLGYSSWHMEVSGKGFSFLKNETLDMRYGNTELTAKDIISTYKEAELEKILEEFGEETFARQIAKKIVQQRKAKPITSTFELKELVESVIPGRLQHGRIHCATKTFQALRIAVNQELDQVQKALPEALQLLAHGGRLAVISFHSLEDRIVKTAFKEWEKTGAVTILTKKPVVAQAQELMVNPRARSAKLRVIIKN